MAELLSWFQEPPGPLYVKVAQLLVELWLRDDGLGKTVAELSWIASLPIGEEAPVTLTNLRDIADADLDMAKRISGYPWLTDGVSRDGEAGGLSALVRIAANDLELARQVSGFSWFVDDVTGDEGSVLYSLVHIVAEDLELARQVSGFPWFIDGVTNDEAWGLYALGRIVGNDLELARQTVGLPWFIDGVTNDEAWALDMLVEIAANDLELARQAASLTWFIDGLTNNEARGLFALGNVAARDSGMAREIGTSPWLSWQEDLSPYLLRSLDSISASPDALGKLTAQPWFADGLDYEEAAFVVALSGVVGKPHYDELLASHFTLSTTVSLPLAGKVRIWAFQETPFPPQDDDLLMTIEDTARIIEGFLSVPFPTTDIILLVADEDERLHSLHVGAWFAFTHMVSIRYSGRAHAIVHETGHYYFNTGPRWFVEGGARLVEVYVADRTNGQPIRERRFIASREAEECLVPNQRENIHDFEYVWSQGTVSPYCIYTLGENFLLRVLATIGEEAMSAALGELLVEGSISEEKIYEAFVKHTPPEKLKSFLSLYRTLHGGPYADDSG